MSRTFATLGASCCLKVLYDFRFKPLSDLSPFRPFEYFPHSIIRDLLLYLDRFTKVIDVKPCHSKYYVYTRCDGQASTSSDESHCQHKFAVNIEDL